MQNFFQCNTFDLPSCPSSLLPSFPISPLAAISRFFQVLRSRTGLWQPLKQIISFKHSVARGPKSILCIFETIFQFNVSWQTHTIWHKCKRCKTNFDTLFQLYPPSCQTGSLHAVDTRRCNEWFGGCAAADELVGCSLANNWIIPCDDARKTKRLESKRLDKLSYYMCSETV